MRRKRFWIMALVLALVSARHTAWAATVTVDSTTDVSDGDTSSITNLIANPGPDGVISLREAIAAANNTSGDDTIAFNIPAATDSGCNAGTGVCTIQPTSVLPALSGGGTTIDGYTQLGALQATDTTSATLKIEFDGTNAGAGVDGFNLNSSNNLIRGLAINRFSAYGVRIYGSFTTGNTVSGNYIGTDANGTTDLGNAYDGVRIGGSAQNNTIGGDVAGERNVISGNDWSGVYISGSDTTGNTVSGNYIGTDASGTTDLGNAYDGVRIRDGAQNNTIGGDAAGERNVISGNDEQGVYISGSGTMSNTVSGNYIGTDASGTLDRGNTWSGVYIDSGAQNNTIGGDTADERNVISGNDTSGVYIYSSDTTGNIVSGNYIGTDASGTASLGNNVYGVRIRGGAQNNTVGPGNVIAHNGSDGVEVNESNTTGNTITRNSIFSNTMGIDLTNNANGNIAAPVIVTTTVGSVNVVGTACASCTVEVFENSDTDGEGETYVGDTTATASGAFTVTVSSLGDPYLTATATDSISGTSEFSAVFTSTVTGRNIYLPVILRSY
jgi:hypothetical protein